MRLIEMDLFKYHDKPEDLKGHHEADDIVFDRVWQLARKNKPLTVKQENTLAKSSKHSLQKNLDKHLQRH